MKSVQLKCYRCGKDNDVIDMRYAAANRMICKTCMEKGKNLNAFPSEAKKSQTTGFELKKEAPTKDASPKEEQTEYTCQSCHYTFKRKKSANVTMCPYCSLEGTVEVKSGKTADNLIKESTD